MSIDDAKPEEWHEAAYLARVAGTSASVDPTPRDIERLNQVLDRPFGEVLLVTRAYVFLLHQMGKVHVEVSVADDFPWRVVAYPSWGRGRYRVVAVEKPKTKPSIDWSHVAPEYKWLAQDVDGTAWLFSVLPKIDADRWISYDVYYRADRFASYAPGDCDWKDSLVERPPGA